GVTAGQARQERRNGYEPLLRCDRQTRRREDPRQDFDQRAAARLSWALRSQIISQGRGKERVMQAELPTAMRQTIQQQGGLSNDARVMMLFEANKKAAVVAYLLWFFLGLFGAHNF